MTTQNAYHPLPGIAALCMVVPGFLTQAECRAHIARGEGAGFASAASDYPPSYRNNERRVIDDPGLAGQLLDRLQGIAPVRLGPWSLAAVNERFRYCRYLPGQQFQIHQDGVHHRGHGLASRLSFMVYLSDPEQFEGGDTVFYADGPGAAPREIGRVRPEAGSLILFDHALWHAGAIVTGGVKHIMRSDLLYRCAAARPDGPFQPGHEGYVWALEQLGGGAIASAGRDCAIRLWSGAGAALGQLAGHTQSVLGLAALAGRRLASVSRDRSLRLWDLDSGQCERSVQAHQGAVLAVASLPGARLATGGADARLRLWDQDGAPAGELTGHRGWVWALAALGEEQLVSASEDGSVKVWHQGSGRCLHSLHGATAWRTVAVSPCGQLIVAGNIAGELAVWQATSSGWRSVERLQGHSAAVRRVRFIAPGILASAGEDRRLCLWNMHDRQLLNAWEHAHFVTDMLALDGALLSCSYGGELRQFPASIEPRKCVQQVGAII